MQLPRGQNWATTIFGHFSRSSVRRLDCFTLRMELCKRVVYVLKSEIDPKRYYTGLTFDIAARLDAHNAGRCPHTASGKPWIIDLIVEFADERRAVAFEKYLKSGSGFEFARRHLR